MWHNIQFIGKPQDENKNKDKVPVCDSIVEQDASNVVFIIELTEHTGCCAAQCERKIHRVGKVNGK
jgi:hypothetical protein